MGNVWLTNRKKSMPRINRKSIVPMPKKKSANTIVTALTGYRSTALVTRIVATGVINHPPCIWSNLILIFEKKWYGR